jgi:uncharacterized protein (TIGR03067 family)
MYWLLTLAVLVAVAGADDPKDAAKKELEQLQGTWTTTALTYNGKDFLADGKAPFRFAIKGEEAVIEGNDRVQKEYAKIRLQIDPAANPRVVDITVTGGVQKDAVVQGIYERKGDELRICARVFGNDRPTEFASPEGSSIVLLVLKREKP